MTEREMAHKTEVPGSSPGWPTTDEKSRVLDDFPLCELILMIATENVKRMMENRFKSNPRLLEE